MAVHATDKGVILSMEIVILNKIRNMLIELGFTEVPDGTLPATSTHVKDEKIYRFGDYYCRPQYFSSIGFFIEYAETLEEAQKNWYDDGEGFALDLGEDVILEELRKELLYSIDELCSHEPHRLIA